MKQMCIGLLVFTLLYQIGDVDTQCTDDQYVTYAGDCLNCYHNCYSCGNDITCIWCPSGCPCEKNCTFNCYSNKTNCQTCPDGYYKSYKSCRRCSSWAYCPQCLTGRYGQLCEETCPAGCRDRLCDKSTGYCTNGCTSGYFLDGVNQCTRCPLGCSSCDSGERCNTCVDQNKWGPVCQHDCIGCSEGCSKTSGCLKNCTDGSFKKYSAEKAGYVCEQCRNSCKQCSSINSCSACVSGYWGYKCQHSCKGCVLTGCDKSSGCTGGCNNGYYLKVNIDGTICHTCPTSCNGFCNKQTGSCIICNTNQFFNITSYLCADCPNKCVSCNSLLNCNDGCIDGWTGGTCDTKCHVSCLSCNQSFADICNKCSLNFYGDKCKLNCSVNCFVNTDERVCDTRNGSCLHGCKKGFWGAECVLPCSDGCIQDICDQSSGQCTNGCKTEFYGSLCNQTCNEHCSLAPKGNDLNRTCNKMNGTCLFGCIPGSYGGFCDKSCGQNCNGSTCERKSGSCLYGCVSGYEGEACTEAQISETSEPSLVVIGGGAGAGVAVLLLLAVVVIVVMCRRRRNSSKHLTHGSTKDHTPQDIISTDQAPVYSNTNNAGCKAVGDCRPNVVSNQVYVNTAMSMSDICVNEHQINSTVSASPRDEDCLSEEEMVDGEEIDITDSEIRRERENTYYNLGGKRVPVVKLTDYIKHTSSNEIKHEFQELPKGLLKDYKEAKKTKNSAKNKYRFIYPYDETRVVLCDGGSDYMNASYIDGHNRQKEYIASTGPFKKSYDTTNDFWKMIWQEKCETLVMLTNPIENKEVKCIKYWPDIGDSSVFGNIHVTCVTEDVYADFTIRTLAVTKKEEKFNVCHLHFTAWPDKGVPHDVTSMIEFRQKVRSLHKDKTCPIVVHCSAGIGQTGTFIALDLMTNEGEDRGSVDILGSVFNLRYQRCNMVQTPDQYVYLHHALLHSLTFDCRSIPGDTFLQNYNKLLEKNDGQRIIDNQYQQLQSIAEEMTDDERTEIDRNKSLVKKNRSGADVPVDENRVKLKENRKPEDSDYINAVYINSFRKHQKFIVAQTPLPSTVVDFLTLIYQEKCSCVVSMEEANMKDKTVKDYWPADNQIVKHGVFQVSCKESKTEKHYMIKKLSLTYHGPKGMETHDVNLFIFTNWCEGAPVPSSSDSLLDLVKTVDVVNYKTETNSPILIHCRTGAERSCLYCAVSILIEKMDFEHEVSVVNTLRQIKARRMSAISSIVYFGLLLAVVLVSGTDGHSKHRSSSRWYSSEASCRAHCYRPGTVCVPEGSRWCCTKAVIAEGCEAPPAPEHGEVYTPCGTGYGKIAVYFCEEGYELDGGYSFRFCESGGWSGSEPVCRRDCGKLEDPDHGDVILNGTLEGDTAIYVCDRGYETTSGTSPRTCVSGSWSGLPYECSPVVCPDPPDVANGAVTFSSPLEFEAEVVYSCDSGYDLNGPNRRYCQSIGLISGTSPTCSPKDCGDPDPICDGKDVDAPSTILNSTATYSCLPDYHLVGSATRTCTASGWSGDPPCCEEDAEAVVTCPMVSDPAFGDVDATGNVEGSTATYTCVECFSINNASVSVCQSDGTWSGGARTCGGVPSSTSGGSTFYFFNTCKQNWHGAQAICREINGDLAKIPNVGRNNFLKSALGTFGSAGEDWWIGLNDEDNEDDFRWPDGTDDSTYDDWAGGQPNNFGGDEDCARMREDQGYNWWDADCSNYYWFVCEV